VTLGYTTNLWLDALPKGFLHVAAGVFNGESSKERAPLNNIDDDYLYAARLEVRPFGTLRREEADLRPVTDRSSPRVAVGGSWTQETRGADNGDYEQRRLGADLAVRWHGVSLYGEYYRYDRDYTHDLVDPDRRGIGWSAQLGAMVPAPYLREHLELAARLEHWDPEIAHDDTRATELLSPIPGAGPGRAGSTQAHDDLLVGLNWYFTGHRLKLQAAYTHRSSIEPWVLSASDDGVAEEVDDDAFLLQLTLGL